MRRIGSRTRRVRRTNSTGDNREDCYAGQAMAQRPEDLTGAQREMLMKSIGQMATDTPTSESAVTRIK